MHMMSTGDMSKRSCESISSLLYCIRLYANYLFRKQVALISSQLATDLPTAQALI